jgi:N6-adenosine-specific RNA methylase IME4
MIPHPAVKYKVIYADPPWSFSTYSTKGQGKGAEQHYNTMPIADICNLNVAEIADNNCVLFLWVCQAQLKQALALIEAWGFSYKTVGYYWMKTKGGIHNQDRFFYNDHDVRLGMGYHTRAGCEQLWIATRGKGYKRLSKGEPQVLMSPLREHSRKPDEIASSIERLVGNVPRIELFARTRRQGWDVWGNQTNAFKAIGGAC